MSKKEDVPAPAQAPAQLMYIGPTIVRPVLLSHRRVYSGGIPVHARDLAAKDKDLASCFVPLAEAGKALRELEGYPGTPGDQPAKYTHCFYNLRKRYLEVQK